MNATAHRTESADIAELREQRAVEVDSQIVHHLIHRRPGWLEDWVLQAEGKRCGYASVAVAGPWQDHRTLLEFFVVPGLRHRAFALLETLLHTSHADSFELQTNCGLQGLLPHVVGKNVACEKIVFQDGPAPELPAPDADLRSLTPEDEVRAAMERRAGGGEWSVEVNGETVGRGGLLFHYNMPYGDVWMDIEEPYRRRGLGTWLVQQVKREARRLGAVPAARCSPDNIASLRTLQGAGFVPVGHILIGQLPSHDATL